MEPKAIKVTIEYDNGLEVQCIGKDAQDFMEQASFSYPGSQRLVVSTSWDRIERLPASDDGRGVGLSITKIKAVITKPARAADPDAHLGGTDA